MNHIEFNKTGNFWMDNGIVGLFRILHEIENDAQISYNTELSADTLKVVADSDRGLVDILNEARAAVAKHYLKQTDGVGWIYDGEVFEVYRKTDFKMHLKPFFLGKTPKTEGSLLVPDARDSELGGKGRRMSTAEYQKFLTFKEENSTATINGKKVQIAGKGFINKPPVYEIGEDFRLNFTKDGKKICVFSGKRYNNADVITGMNYPFLTGKSGELNFSSFLDEKPSISSLYSFIALFSFYNLNYLLQDSLKHYFVLYDEDLYALSEFLNTIQRSPDQLNKPDFCSFETQIMGTVYEAESFFNFLLSVYEQIKDQLDADEYFGKLYSKSVFTLSNDGNIFRVVKEYTSLNDLFELFSAYKTADGTKNHFSHFINFVRFFSQRLDGGKYNTIWRNKLCAEVLGFKSILRTVESFIAEVKMKEGGNFYMLDKVLEIYNLKTQKNMKAEMVDLCKSLGNRIGAHCREKDDKGILFSIRNAKNRTEFLNVLAETQFRTGVSYSEAFFKELPDDAQWEEYKALVSIFAMNSFLYKEKKSTDNN